jgi:hypothetical protein
MWCPQASKRLGDVARNDREIKKSTDGSGESKVWQTQKNATWLKRMYDAHDDCWQNVRRLVQIGEGSATWRRWRIDRNKFQGYIRWRSSMMSSRKEVYAESEDDENLTMAHQSSRCSVAHLVDWERMRRSGDSVYRFARTRQRRWSLMENVGNEQPGMKLG